MSDEIFFANLSAENEKFWDGTLGPESLNDVLRAFGLDIEKSVLLEIYPDSGSTWIVHVIDQEGLYVEYDVDLDPPELLERRELKVPVKARPLREYMAAVKLSQLVRDAV